MKDKHERTGSKIATLNALLGRRLPGSNGHVHLSEMHFAYLI